MSRNKKKVSHNTRSFVIKTSEADKEKVLTNLNDFLKGKKFNKLERQVVNLKRLEKNISIVKGSKYDYKMPHTSELDDANLNYYIFQLNPSTALSVKTLAKGLQFGEIMRTDSFRSTNENEDPNNQPRKQTKSNQFNPTEQELRDWKPLLGEMVMEEFQKTFLTGMQMQDFQKCFLEFTKFTVNKVLQKIEDNRKEGLSERILQENTDEKEEEIFQENAENSFGEAQMELINVNLSKENSFGEAQMELINVNLSKENSFGEAQMDSNINVNLSKENSFGEAQMDSNINVNLSKENSFGEAQMELINVNLSPKPKENSQMDSNVNLSPKQENAAEEITKENSSQNQENTAAAATKEITKKNSSQQQRNEENATKEITKKNSIESELNEKQKTNQSHKSALKRSLRIATRDKELKKKF